MFPINDTKPLITVIVPIYNGEQFLSVCIKSVLEQSYSNWELLLINDGSSDRSVEICKQYTSFDSRISLLQQPHSGVSVARNAGLTYGHGDYFFFLDCDDFIHPQALETELGLMQKFGCAFAGAVFSNVAYDFQLSEPPAPIVPTYRCFSPDELQNLFGNHRVYDLWAIGGKLLSHSVIDGLCFPETIASGEDTLFLLDVIARNKLPAVILMEKAYYYRRLHQDNTFYLQTFELKINHIEAYLRLRTRHFELYGTPGCWEQLCVSNVFNWYVASQTSHGSDHYTDEFRQRLLNLLHDDYTRFLSVKRKCTIRLYLFCPPLYRFLKKRYWQVYKLLTGKDDPALEYQQRRVLSFKA